ncbi:MAG: hypothetical protein ACK5W0_06260 [Labrys sp. (in: a-proteobacteria)]
MAGQIMAGGSVGYQIVRGAAVAAMALGLSGCGTFSMFGGASEPQPVAATPEPSVEASAAPQTRTIMDIDVQAECPSVKVTTGGSAVTVPASAAGTQSVRYQISITDVARECVLEPGNKVMIKVGVRGVVTLGGAGSPGAFSAPLKIEVKDRSEAVIASETPRVGAKVGADGQPARFQYVTQAIRVPISPSKPLRGYDILVAFQNR